MVSDKNRSQAHVSDIKFFCPCNLALDEKFPNLGGQYTVNIAPGTLPRKTSQDTEHKIASEMPFPTAQRNSF